MSKALLVIDIDDIDIENTQATYIELKCNDNVRQISLFNHWLKPLPAKIPLEYIYMLEKDNLITSACRCKGWNDYIDEILGEENEYE